MSGEFSNKEWKAMPISDSSKVTIEFDNYKEETTSAIELRQCKVFGPWYQEADWDEAIRIPHSGFSHRGITFTLSGFGKLDKKPIMQPSAKVKDKINLMFGKGYMLIKPHHWEAIYYAEKKGLIDDLFRRMKKHMDAQANRLDALVMSLSELGATAQEEPIITKHVDTDTRPEF